MRKTLLLGVAAVALSIGLPPPAHATLQIAAQLGASTFMCSDNQASCDQNPAVGTLQLANQTVAGIQVNGSLQTSTKGSTNILNASSLSVINTTDATVPYTVTVSDTNFVGPISAFVTSGSGVFQQAIGSSALLRWWDDPANGQGADTPTDTPGALIDSFSKDVTLTADSFSHNGSGPTTDPDLFSMTEQISGNLTAGGQLLNRGQTEIKLQTVAEPGSLALLGAALIGLGFVRRRNR